MIERDGVTLAVDDSGEVLPVLLAHGLTATRRYGVMGSRSLQRSGQRVIGDTAYGNIEVREELEARSILVLAPVHSTSP